MAVLTHNVPNDLKGLALYKLFDLNYEKMPEVLMDVYKSSKSHMLRLQCLHLSAYYQDIYDDILKLALNDPYEFIRRKAVHFMGKVGRNDFIPYIVDLYMDDYMSERIQFNAITSCSMLNSALVKEEFKRRIEKDNVYNGEEFYKQIETELDKADALRDFVWGALMNKNLSTRGRLNYMSSVRNYPYTQMIGDLLNILTDSSEDQEIRTCVAEALGWYVLCERKADIVAACQKVIEKEENLSEQFKDELYKTINRLKTYMR
jgi:hypothetical protein